MPCALLSYQDYRFVITFTIYPINYTHCVYQYHYFQEAESSSEPLALDNIDFSMSTQETAVEASPVPSTPETKPTDVDMAVTDQAGPSKSDRKGLHLSFLLAPNQ